MLPRRIPFTIFTLITLCSVMIHVSSQLSPPQCLPIPSQSICRPLLNYTQALSSSTAPCLNELEAQFTSIPVLASTLSGLPGIQGTVGEQCAQLISTVYCQSKYTPCQANNDPVTAPSSSWCPLVNATCFPFKSLLIGSVPGLATFFDCASTSYAQVSSQSQTQTPSNIQPQTQTPLLPNPQTTLTGAAVPTPTCQPLKTTSICAGLTADSIYVPAGLTQDIIEFGTILPKRQLIAQLPITSPHGSSMAVGCRDSFVRMMCNKAYPPCRTDVLQTPYGVRPTPFPQLVCQSQCIETNATCAPYYQFLLSRATAPAGLPPAQAVQFASLQLFLNCTGAHTISGVITDNTHPIMECRNRVLVPGLLDYPVSTTTFSSAASTNCTIPSSSSIVVPQVVASCPAPLLFPQNPNSNNVIQAVPTYSSSCATPCATLLFTDSEWSSANIFTQTMFVLSFILLTFLLSTWAVFPSKRKQQYLVCFNFCLWFISFIMIFSIPASNRNLKQVGCIDNSDPGHQSDGGYCVLQGVTIMYFILAVVFWWLFIAFDLFLKIVLNKKITHEQARRMKILFHVIAWCVPALFVIIALGEGIFGRHFASAWCFLVADNKGLEWSLFYFPVGVLLVIGASLMVSIIVVMVKTTNATDRQQGSGSRRKPGWWHRYLRPCMFIFVFLFIFSFTVAYRGTLYTGESSYQQSATDYVICLLSQPAEVCGAHPQTRPSISLWFLAQFVFAGQGLLNFLLWGTQKQNVLLWYYWLTCQGFDSQMASGNDDNKADTSSGGVTKSAGYDTARSENAASPRSMNERPTKRNAMPTSTVNNTPATPRSRPVVSQQVAAPERLNTTSTIPGMKRFSSTTTSPTLGSSPPVDRIVPTQHAYKLSSEHVIAVEWGSNPIADLEDDSIIPSTIPSPSTVSTTSSLPLVPAIRLSSAPHVPVHPPNTSARMSTPVHNPLTRSSTITTPTRPGRNSQNFI